MTRDQWVTRCANRLRDNGGMDTGSAAAYAQKLHSNQVSDNGRNPSSWDDPERCADAEIKELFGDVDAE